MQTSSPVSNFDLIRVDYSGIHGVGLFSTANIKCDDVLGIINDRQVSLVVENEARSEEIKNWIGLDADEWIDTSNSIFRYINHSCEPNVALYGRKVVATKNIFLNDEIVMDYSLTDADEKWNIRCNCRKLTCRRDVGSIYSLSLPEYMHRQKLIHLPFRKLFEERQQSFMSTDLGLNLQSA